jgi:hypothetical protein
MDDSEAEEKFREHFEAKRESYEKMGSVDEERD